MSMSYPSRYPHNGSASASSSMTTTNEAASSLEYYQVGGFGCSRNISVHSYYAGGSGWVTSNQLARELLSGDDKNGVELVFGITPCGASYLLVPRTLGLAQLGNFDSSARNARIYRPEGFLSLSPVRFTSLAQLESALESLMSKGKGRGDRSKANKGFTQGGEAENVVSKQGRMRAGFEQQRLLIKAVRFELDAMIYGVSLPQWFHTSSARVVAFTYNLWAMDHRGWAARGDDLQILDVGWSEFNLVEFGSGPISTTHIKLTGTTLSNANPANFAYGLTETLPNPQVCDRLQQLFATHDTSNQGQTVVLVSNADEALHVLRVLGVQTSAWHRGVEPLIGARIINEGDKLPDRRKENSFKFNGRGARDRSRSPRRDHKRWDTKDFKDRKDWSSGDSKDSWDHKEFKDVKDYKDAKSRARSPVQATRSSYPAYLIDVRDTYRLVMNEPVADGRVQAMATRLQPEMNDGHSIAQLTAGWCAGNESRLLGFIWREMATGNALEEQRKDWVAKRFDVGQGPPSASAPQNGATADGDEDEDDWDPNEAPEGPRGAQPAPQVRDPYEDDEDDDY